MTRLSTAHAGSQATVWSGGSGPLSASDRIKYSLAGIAGISVLLVVLMWLGGTVL